MKSNNYSLLLVSSVLMVLIDYLYISSVSKYFNKQIKMVQGSPIKLDLLSAIVCYLFLIFGLYYFVLQKKGSVLDAFFLGLVIYMVYENTNKAILKKWSWNTVLLDGFWGGILFAITTYLTYAICNKFKL